MTTLSAANNNGGADRLGSFSSTLRVVRNEETSGLAAVRSQITSIAQKRQTDRLRSLVVHHMHNWAPHELDECLALHYVAWAGDQNDLATHLIKSGCNPYHPDYNGDSVFHYAARGGNLKLLKSLYEQFGSGILNCLNNFHFNLMLTAAAEAPDDRAYEILLLLEWLYLCGVSIESQDSQGRSPLLWAAQRGSLTVVQWLLARNANLHHRDHMGRTALHMACTNSDEELVMFLCDKGAIGLIGCESNDDPRLNTAVKLCWRRGSYFLGVSLIKWHLFKSMFGSIALLKNPYARYFLFISIFNFILGCFVVYHLFLIESSRASSMFIYWLVLWAATMISWCLSAFVDPGYVKNDVIADQSTRCSNDMLRDVESRPPVTPHPTTQPYMCDLRKIETESLLISHQLIKLNKEFKLFKKANFPAQVEAQFDTAAKKLYALREQESKIAVKVGSERRSALPKLYVREVFALSPRKVCLTCQTVKPFRAHHCGDCAKCVHRFDHHCVWVDNCIGMGNQRNFMFFLTFLLATMLLSFYMFFVFCIDSLWEQSDPHASIVSHTSIPDGIGLQNVIRLLERPIFYISFANSCLNFIWLGFVGYLFVRTSKSILSNVTFYENLRRPPHIQERFRNAPKTYIWDLYDLNFTKALKHIAGFCFQTNAYDAEDYRASSRGRSTAGKRSTPNRNSKSPTGGNRHHGHSKAVRSSVHHDMSPETYLDDDEQEEEEELRYQDYYGISMGNNNSEQPWETSTPAGSWQGTPGNHNTSGASFMGGNGSAEEMYPADVVHYDLNGTPCSYGKRERLIPPTRGEIVGDGLSQPAPLRRSWIGRRPAHEPWVVEKLRNIVGWRDDQAEFAYHDVLQPDQEVEFSDRRASNRQENNNGDASNGHYSQYYLSSSGERVELLNKIGNNESNQGILELNLLEDTTDNSPAAVNDHYNNYSVPRASGLSFGGRHHWR